MAAKARQRIRIRTSKKAVSNGRKTISCPACHGKGKITMGK